MLRPPKYVLVVDGLTDDEVGRIGDLDVALGALEDAHRARR